MQFAVVDAGLALSNLDFLVVSSVRRRTEPFVPPFFTQTGPEIEWKGIAIDCFWLR